MHPGALFAAVLVVIGLLGAGGANPVQQTALDYNDKSDDVQVLVVEKPYGEAVTLRCRSCNRDTYSFLYWHLSEKNVILGPTNKDYHMGKYRFEVLSGNLSIRALDFTDSGLYNCVSRGVTQTDFLIRSTRLVVAGNWQKAPTEAEPEKVNVFRIIVIIISVLVLLGIGFLIYQSWANQSRRYPTYLAADDEDSADELFIRPGTSRRSPQPIVRHNSNENFESDTPGISTDFKSILDTANSTK